MNFNIYGFWSLEVLPVKNKLHMTPLQSYVSFWKAGNWPVTIAYFVVYMHICEVVETEKSEKENTSERH